MDRFFRATSRAQLKAMALVHGPPDSTAWTWQPMRAIRLLGRRGRCPFPSRAIGSWPFAAYRVERLKRWEDDRMFPTFGLRHAAHARLRFLDVQMGLLFDLSSLVPLVCSAVKRFGILVAHS